MLTVVPGGGSGHEGGKDGSPSLIDEIVREGARRMLAEALQAEVDAYIAAHAAERDANGRRLVVRNGCHQPREILTSAGAVEVTAPRVNDRRTDPDTGERKRFASAILPPWCRKTPKITEVLPLLYLHGLSSGDFVAALGQFPGSPAGLSAAVITRLTETWRGEQRAFAERDLSGVDYVYLRAGGIHVNIRLEEHKLCLLVMIGVRADGRKELIALADGYRESAESRADLLRDCARRGMRAPVLAAGDGALGFWNGLREVFPGTREGRCWSRKTANVLAALPRSAHPGAKKALAGIWDAEDKQHALAAVKAFQAACGARFHAYIVVSLLTGARTEELRALTWSYVDLDSDPPFMMVWRSVRAGGDTKTRKSRRTLKLPQRCVDVLRDHQTLQDEIRQAAGSRWQDNGLVFPSRVGAPADASHVRRSFRTVVAAAGLDPREWTPRELRHSFVSLLSDADVPIEHISRLVGHSSTTTTETIYRKQIRPVIVHGADVMDRIFSGEADHDA